MVKKSDWFRSCESEMQEAWVGWLAERERLLLTSVRKFGILINCYCTEWRRTYHKVIEQIDLIFSTDNPICLSQFEEHTRRSIQLFSLNSYLLSVQWQGDKDYFCAIKWLWLIDGNKIMLEFLSRIGGAKPDFSKWGGWLGSGLMGTQNRACHRPLCKVGVGAWTSNWKLPPPITCVNSFRTWGLNFWLGSHHTTLWLCPWVLTHFFFLKDVLYDKQMTI